LKVVQSENSILRSLSHRDCDKGACDTVSSLSVLTRKGLWKEENHEVETFSKTDNAFESLADSSKLITTLAQLRDALRAAEAVTARIERSTDSSWFPVSSRETSQCRPQQTSPEASNSGSRSPSRAMARHCSSMAAQKQSEQELANHIGDWEAKRHREDTIRVGQRGAVESSHVTKYQRHAAIISAPGSSKFSDVIDCSLDHPGSDTWAPPLAPRQRHSSDNIAESRHSAQPRLVNMSSDTPSEGSPAMLPIAPRRS